MLKNKPKCRCLRLPISINILLVTYYVKSTFWELFIILHYYHIKNISGVLLYFFHSCLRNPSGAFTKHNLKLLQIEYVCFYYVS